MADKRPVGDAVLVDRFWHNYFSILEKERIHKTARPWYRKHVEAYIKAHPGRRFAGHIPNALRLLFCDHIRADLAQACDCYQLRAFAR